MNASPRILWLDCLGGIIVGIVVLAICRPLSNWECLPVSIVMGMGIANLIYGRFSLFVTLCRPRPKSLIATLAVANMAWLLVCVLITPIWWEQISWLGLLHVLGEGVYVAGLGYTEWTLRDSFST